ncbi:DUF3035 domain-containing protein [Parvularcula marina]|jgi:hypothetical protein|uniref:DUF3035 domain-containing protein n=1 Tax=Parvularcula marina TaxID=2292771 RepID=A0A371RJM5_9PROT|nr:DUF3035 domain-containing protein [Parvularcula marina]RFB05651.1 DUF3035 domain-containing protein [Parvularcula marina]
MIARYLSLAVLAGSALLITGCGSLGNALGTGKNPPDEFAIVTKAPLTVPPDYALRPPQPGETRPERLSTADRTRQLLIGDESSAPPTNGELALLQSVGALDVDDNIRATLAAENGGRAQKSESLANQLIFWTFEDGQIDDSRAPLRVDNAEAWKAERHDSIEAVTGGGQVVISRDQRILNLPGVK